MKRALLGAALLCAPAIAVAFVIGPNRWPAAQTLVHTGRLPPAYASAVAQSAEAWRAATGFALQTDGAVRGACDTVGGALLDGVELDDVDCSGDGLGSQTVALTEWYYDGAGRILEFGVTFAEGERWSVYDGPLRFDELDFRRVALHELGHVLGLDHELRFLAIMNPAVDDHYRLQADDVAGVFARYPELRPVEILGPRGDVTEEDPDFTWLRVEGASRYGFKLEAPGGSVIREIYTATQLGCATGPSICGLRRGVPLGPGPYTFRVYAEVDGIAGKWWPQTFTRTGPSNVPGVPTPVAPSGTLTTSTPDFTWSAVDPATDYRLEITPPGGASPFYVWYAAAAAGCGGGEPTCSVASPRPLGEGAHRFRVQGSNGPLRGPWSTALAFALALRPGQPTLLEPAPSSSLPVSRPDFVWDAVARAASYRLHVRDARGNVTRIDRAPADLGCDGAAPCMLALPTELPNGATRAWVQASNGFGKGPWSPEVRFTVSAPVVLPGATGLLAPPPSVMTRRPDIVWAPASAATAYFLRRVDPLGRVLVTSIGADAAGCLAPEATACVFTPPENLPYGAHTLQVRGRNVFGAGPWSALLRFRVERPPAP